MSFIKIPFLEFLSSTEDLPEKDINNLCWDWEEKTGVIDCTFYHGFIYADIADAGASVLTITDDNPELAQDASMSVAELVWEKRKQFKKRLLTPEEGIKQAISIDKFPIIINESSDNPGSGAPGDGTFLLKEMLKTNLPLSCFGSIYDPEVVKIAHEAGIGSTINVKIGGKTDTLHGEPLSISAYVKCLTDGIFIQSSEMNRGSLVNLGKSVRLQVGNVDVIVCSVKSQTLDEQIFLLHGINVYEYKLVALKSCQHFRAAFSKIGEKIITVDSPGIGTSNVSYFEYKNIKRPIYPLDIDCSLSLDKNHHLKI